MFFINIDNKNYVVKIQSEEDKRIYYIELTPKIKEYFLESYKEESEIHINLFFNDTSYFLFGLYCYMDLVYHKQ